MPIHRHPQQRLTKPYKQEEPPQHHVDIRRLSEESIRTKYFDGPVPDTVTDDFTLQVREEGRVSNHGEAICSDRAELIERIKRGESPTWIPNQALQEEYLKTNNRDVSTLRRQPSEWKSPSPLLPAVELKSITQEQDNTSDDESSIPLKVQRPSSALHAGDFKEERGKEKESRDSPRVSGGFDAVQNGSLGTAATYPWYVTPSLRKTFGSSPQVGPLGTSPTYPWYDASSPHKAFATGPQVGPLGTSPTYPWYDASSSPKASATTPQVSPLDEDYVTSDRRPWRSRAPSISSYSSSSYVLKAPTTPLVQQSNNADLDFSTTIRSVSPEKNSRRHTLPPATLQDMHSSPSGQASASSQAACHPLSYRRDASYPYGHHQRRSLTSNWSMQASSSPQTPAYPRPRRTSFSSEASPRQHAHMVGSYEESILRGWMSTAPSKPLDFTAQIGVLGKGTCKPKCPAHLTIPFPAVFYSWSAGNGRSFVNDDPSPYVGHIDLHHSSSPPEPEQPPLLHIDSKGESQTDQKCTEHGTTAAKLTPTRSKKRKCTSPASAPPRGSYRIPEQGQLQIIIKNPNKTAVKLFLIPYDLSGMGPGTKTFVRQRSYSADPVIDSPLVSKCLSDPAFRAGKPTLRYLIHLNICSPSKGRFYLYQQIRVVFANRVPDNKEQLRNEIQVPQPRFSTYKPTRDSFFGTNLSAGAKLTAEKAYRRRSSGFGFGSDEADSHATQTFTGGTAFPFDIGTPVPPIPAIPFNLAVSRQRARTGQESGNVETMDLDSSRPTTASDLQSPVNDRTLNQLNGVQLSSSYKSNTSSNGSDDYNKLIKGDSGYGGVFERYIGVFGRPGTPEPGEGLLARRLKGLGVQRDSRQVEEDM